ncbi:DHA2 family multidrug resistance protein-like MFS transporter [Thermocatellispora tengchongensis]|uniref:DHA2 family multidrug resistance protein-like MFS transporter n=1 Tax=Thermocatellispora tengchongensis TaxID=1073253 RepID=A0A840P5F1_9ACTN|nr:MFS transporter [Thermocatellispora tengchongensis]MBB5131255.1 DHA2 family multidrug resistance protein-like MFS transporter [Thermocatellispora tengchongensis]
MTKQITVPAEKGYRRRWAGLAVLSASLLLVVMDMTILNVALPALAADLRPGSVELLWMVDVYPLVLSGLLVSVTALGDRWGRKRMLLTGFAVFGVVSAAVVLAANPETVIALRALLGVGGAMIMPSTLSMIRAMFADPRERATALGVWSAMAAVGSALGPILGGLLVERFSWQAAFLVNVPVMVVAVIAGAFLLPESRNPTPGRWDFPGTLLSMAGMVALVYAIKHAGSDGFAAPATLAAFAVAALCLGWFAARCLRRPDPLLEIRLFRRPAFAAGVVAALSTSMAMAGMMLLIAQWMQLVLGYSALQTGLLLLPAAVAGGVVAPLTPALAARTGARAVLAGGLLLSAAGYAALFLAPSPLGLGWATAGLVLIGAGMGSLTIASAVIMSSSPAAKSGSAAAIEETAYELGGALGVAVLGSVAAAVYRAGLPVARLTELVAAGGEAAARESLAGALAVAAALGAEGAQVAEEARRAFVTALETFGLAGAVLMLAAAAAVWLLAPRTLDLSASQH